MGIKLLTEYLLTEVILALISSIVVGISKAQLVVDLQSGIRMERMMLMYLKTISFARNAI